MSATPATPARSTDSTVPAVPGSPAARVSVSVLGLGLMGTALATAFMGAGHDVTVWNRTHARTGPLAARGARPALTPSEAVALSDVTVLCLTHNAAVEDIFAVLGGQVTGKTLVNLTNGTPEQARALSRWATAQGARYVDGGIMAVPQMIGGPHAYVFYSGDEEAFRAYRPLFAALGGTRFVGTDPGLASVHDLALLTGMYGMFVGVSHAFALARSEGIAAGDLAGPLSEWIGAMLLGVPADAEAVDSGEHRTDVSNLLVNQAALTNFTATYRARGLDTAFFEQLQSMLDRAVDRGHGADGLSRLVDVITK
ncbi:NAD(P)-dependent oxidoreductase [Streptomyces yaizuensis]|uniref:NAD(P)-binding domain-containing protein n=1 Tax=Streptomyces yaizuensis TaxID=2989713 RepID=A0ABQ5P476_9ACTN|nr:NAD(P)-binding domain-containing protein [Streptomyces sp. YSPA8]GLF97408.1 NAD(P)-binding domain-containing protein [Streptomyces sp. YSPA8]